MTTAMTWLASLATIVILLVYELGLLVVGRRDPGSLARAAHASLREEWFAAVSAQQGTEILAVQTLRNSLMSATMTASTSALGLMGTATLALPSLHEGFGAAAGIPVLSAQLVLQLVLMALLFASLVASAMAVRYYNLVGFISGMPVQSAERKRWAESGVAYIRRAGILYSWGLRFLILVAPILAAIVHPWAGPIAAVLVVAVLWSFDRFGKR